MTCMELIAGMFCQGIRGVEMENYCYVLSLFLLIGESGVLGKR